MTHTFIFPDSQYRSRAPELCFLPLTWPFPSEGYHHHSSQLSQKDTFGSLLFFFRWFTGSFGHHCLPSVYHLLSQFSDAYIWQCYLPTWKLLTLLCKKWKMNKNLLYSTRNFFQYSLMTYMGVESKKEWIYIYVQLTRFAVQQKLANEHCKSAIVQ